MSNANVFRPEGPGLRGVDTTVLPLDGAKVVLLKHSAGGGAGVFDFVIDEPYNGLYGCICATGSGTNRVALFSPEDPELRGVGTTVLPLARTKVVRKHSASGEAGIFSFCEAEVAVTGHVPEYGVDGPVCVTGSKEEAVVFRPEGPELRGVGTTVLPLAGAKVVLFEPSASGRVDILGFVKL